MLERLQQKWKVTGTQLALILCTFAVGGSLTGYLGRRLLGQLNINQQWLWIILYILIITTIWPIMVIAVSIFFGQFSFFRSYLVRMGRRMTGTKKAESPTFISLNKKIRMAVFASGAGSNAQQIIEYFRKSELATVSIIVCNKPGAGVLKIAEVEHLPVLLIEKENFFRGDTYLPQLQAAGIDFIVLAGFLWKIPSPLIKAFNGRIINIHPALLPKYGGKGMYGLNVHEAVINAKDVETGITIHYVDEQYDHGAVIFQATCPVLSADTPSTLAERIHQLEHKYFPQVIENVLKNLRA